MRFFNSAAIAGSEFMPRSALLAALYSVVLVYKPKLSTRLQ